MSETMVTPLAKVRGIPTYERLQEIVAKADADADAIYFGRQRLDVCLVNADKFYLRHLLLGLITRGSLKQCTLMLNRTLGMKRGQFIAWLNEEDAEGGPGRVYDPAPASATFMTAVLLSNRSVEKFKRPMVDLLLRRGFTNVDGHMQPAVMPHPRPHDRRVAGVSAFAALCDPAYVEGIGSNVHQRLVTAFLKAGGKPFARMAPESAGASAYERAYVHYAYLLHLFPAIPVDKHGFADERVVVRGDAILMNEIYPEGPRHDSPFRFRTRH